MATSELRRDQRSERRFALTVAAAFVLAGLAWVLFTDIVLYTPMFDTELVARLETAKGWAFVGLAGVLVYAITLRGALRLNRARATLAAVIDSIGDGVLLLGRDRTIAHANRAAVQMLSNTPLVGLGAEEFSRKFSVSYPSGALVPPEQFVSQRVFTEGGPLRYKAYLHPPGAAELCIDVTAAAVRDEPHDAPNLVVSVMHDITAAESVERLRDEFFAAAAHSLKTPVAVIKTTVQSLRGVDLAQLDEAIATVDRQCRRLDRTVQNLLVLARVRSSSLRLRHDTVDIAPLVESVCREMQGATRQCTVRCRFDGFPRVRADSERFALAMRDLIDLACRSAVQQSLVSVAVCQEYEHCEIVVCYEPAPKEETMIDACGNHDEAGLDRLVIEQVVAAHGWTLRYDSDSAPATIVIRLPLSKRSGHGG